MAKVPIFAAPLFVLDRRIRAHQAAGRLLEGMKYDSSGKPRTVADKDTPILMLRSVSSQSKIEKGAVKAEQKVEGVLNSVINETMVVRFEFSTKQDNGWVSRNYEPGSGTVKRGHLEWLAAVLDAMETREDDSVVDASLDLSLYAPVQFNCLEPEQAELNTTTVIEVVMTTHPRCRAQRTLAYPGIGHPTVGERPLLVSGAGHSAMDGYYQVFGQVEGEDAWSKDGTDNFPQIVFEPGGGGYWVHRRDASEEVAGYYAAPIVAAGVGGSPSDVQANQWQANGLALPAPSYTAL